MALRRRGPQKLTTPLIDSGLFFLLPLPGQCLRYKTGYLPRPKRPNTLCVYV